MKTQHNWAYRLLALTSLLIVCIVLFASCNSGDIQPTEPATPAGTSKPTDESKPTEKETDEGNDQTEPHVHAWSEWAVTTAPTCTEKGEESRSCSCGEIEKKAVEATGHTEEIINEVKPTCTEAGLTEGKHCSVCNEILVAQEIVEKEAHKEVLDIPIPATCTSSGMTSGKHCCVCNTILIPQEVTVELGHSYKSSTVNATCTSQGYTLQECTRCNDFYKENYTEKKDHSINSNGICFFCNGDFSVKIKDLLGTPSFSWETGTSGYSNNYVDAECTLKNLTGKRIKYITIQLDYKNAVDDVIYSAAYKLTGPFEINANISTSMYVGDSTYGFWASVTNRKETISDVEIYKITIEYFDGTTDICK